MSSNDRLKTLLTDEQYSSTNSAIDTIVAAAAASRGRTPSSREELKEELLVVASNLISRATKERRNDAVVAISSLAAGLNEGRFAAADVVDFLHSFEVVTWGLPIDRVVLIEDVARLARLAPNALRTFARNEHSKAALARMFEESDWLSRLYTIYSQVVTRYGWVFCIPLTPTDDQPPVAPYSVENALVYLIKNMRSLFADQSDSFVWVRHVPVRASDALDNRAQRKALMLVRLTLDLIQGNRYALADNTSATYGLSPDALGDVVSIVKAGVVTSENAPFLYRTGALFKREAAIGRDTRTRVLERQELPQELDLDARYVFSRGIAQFAWRFLRELRTTLEAVCRPSTIDQLSRLCESLDDRINIEHISFEEADFVTDYIFSDVQDVCFFNLRRHWSTGLLFALDPSTHLYRIVGHRSDRAVAKATLAVCLCFEARDDQNQFYLVVDAIAGSLLDRDWKLPLWVDADPIRLDGEDAVFQFIVECLCHEAYRLGRKYNRHVRLFFNVTIPEYMSSAHTLVRFASQTAMQFGGIAQHRTRLAKTPLPADLLGDLTCGVETYQGEIYSHTWQPPFSDPRDPFGQWSKPEGNAVGIVLDPDAINFGERKLLGRFHPMA